MATNFVTTNSIGTGVRIAVVNGTKNYILPNVFVASTNDIAIEGAQLEDLTVAGAVVGETNAVSMIEANASASILVTETGVIRGGYFYSGLFLQGRYASITNYGLISAGNDAVNFSEFNTDPSNQSRFFLVNYGNIVGVDLGYGDGITAIADFSIINNFGNIGSSDSYQDSFSTAYVGSDGVDRITNFGTMVGRIELGGNDDLFDGSQGIVQGIVNGGAGNDTIRSGIGNDTLVGESGADLIDGGDGIDTASFEYSNTVVARLDFGLGLAGDAAGDRYLSIENLIGGSDQDFLVGSDDANRIEGRNGNDTLYGLGGDDILIGGAGGDVMFGGEGRDMVDYSGSSTAISLRLDFAAGTAGDAAGDVMVEVEDVTGSAFNDFVVGTDVFNFVNGLAGADTIFGLGGDDALAGGDGNDILLGGLGNDTLDGSLGSDTAEYSSASAGVTARFDFGIGQAGEANGDVYIGIENLTGSDFADILVGADFEANVLNGRSGADQLFGLSGNDTLIGGAGADALDGGSDFDTADYSTALASVTARLDFGIGQGGDALGDSFVSIENLTGSAFGDVLVGDDVAVGNVLTGGGGADQLFGLVGIDILIGGAGADALVGGAGADQFRFLDPTDGADLITDFVSGTDDIGFAFAAFGINTFTLNTNVFISGAPAANAAVPSILYNTTTGVLSYDVNGNLAGGVTVLATLGDPAHPALAASDLFAFF